MAGLERELAQLNLSDMNRERRASFKAAAKNAWFKRNPEYAEVLGIYADHLLDSTINDGLPELFIHYRELAVSCRREDLVARMMKDCNCQSLIHKHLEYQTVYHDVVHDKIHNGSDKNWHLIGRLKRIIANEGLDYACEKTSSAYCGDFLDFADTFTLFVKSRLRSQNNSEPRLPPEFVRMALGCMETVEDLDDSDLWESLDAYLRPLIDSEGSRRIVLEILEDRIKSHLDEKDINDFVLDFESALAEMGELRQFSLEELEDYNNV